MHLDDLVILHLIFIYVLIVLVKCESRRAQSEVIHPFAGCQSLWVRRIPETLPACASVNQDRLAFCRQLLLYLPESLLDSGSIQAFHCSLKLEKRTYLLERIIFWKVLFEFNKCIIFLRFRKCKECLFHFEASKRIRFGTF